MTAGAVAIVLAAGSGDRLGRGEPKAFLEVAGTPMVVRAAEAAAACPAVGSLVVAVPRGHERSAQTMVAPGKPVVVVSGGRSRHASVRAALAAVPDSASFIVCHDAARPFASPQQFVLVLGALEVTPDAAGAVPVVPVSDTVKRVRGGFVVGRRALERSWRWPRPRRPSGVRPPRRPCPRRAGGAGVHATTRRPWSGRGTGWRRSPGTRRTSRSRRRRTSRSRSSSRRSERVAERARG